MPILILSFLLRLDLSSDRIVSRTPIKILHSFLFSYVTKAQPITNSLEHSLSWETNRSSATQKIPLFYGSRNIMAAITTARHLSLPCARLIQSMPRHPTSWRSILIISSHLLLVFQVVSNRQFSPPKTLHAPLLFLIRSTCPAHPTLSWSPEYLVRCDHHKASQHVQLIRTGLVCFKE